MVVSWWGAGCCCWLVAWCLGWTFISFCCVFVGRLLCCSFLLTSPPLVFKLKVFFVQVCWFVGLGGGGGLFSGFVFFFFVFSCFPPAVPSHDLFFTHLARQPPEQQFSNFPSLAADTAAHSSPPGTPEGGRLVAPHLWLREAGWAGGREGGREGGWVWLLREGRLGRREPGRGGAGRAGRGRAEWEGGAGVLFAGFFLFFFLAGWGFQEAEEAWLFLGGWLRLVEGFFLRRGRDWLGQGWVREWWGAWGQRQGFV